MVRMEIDCPINETATASIMDDPDDSSPGGDGSLNIILDDDIAGDPFSGLDGNPILQGVIVHEVVIPERAVDGWQYDPGENSIRFTRYAIPRAGMEVVASYHRR